MRSHHTVFNNRVAIQSSGDAAAEIKELINANVEKVQTGANLVSRSGELLDEIVSSVEKVTTTVKGSTNASSVQVTMA